MKHIPAYSSISHQKLLHHIKRITIATSHLTPEDKAIYTTKEESVPFNISFRFAPEAIEDLLTRETIESTAVMILKVKKPDYLGESMWEFKHENKIIAAKILDVDWVQSFQRREIDVRPGDSIKADVNVITKYDYDLNVLSVKYIIQRVREIIPLPFQNPLL